MRNIRFEQMPLSLWPLPFISLFCGATLAQATSMKTVYMVPAFILGLILCWVLTLGPSAFLVWKRDGELINFHRIILTYLEDRQNKKWRLKLNLALIPGYALTTLSVQWRIGFMGSNPAGYIAFSVCLAAILGSILFPSKL